MSGNLFNNRGAESDFATFIYHCLMKREMMTYEDLLCAFWKKDESEYKNVNLSAIPGYGSFKHAFLDLKKKLEKVSPGCLIDNGKKGRKKAFLYVGTDDDPLKNELKACCEKKLNDYISFCRTTAGMLPLGWFSSYFQNTQLLLDVNDEYHSGAYHISYGHSYKLDNIELLPVFNNAIMNHQAVMFTYKPYDSEACRLTFHPQFLKEFNHRWFVLGRAEGKPFNPFIVSIDRVVGDIEIAKKVKYIQAEKGFYHHYFKNIVGVTHKNGDKVATIVLRTFSNYIHNLVLTKKMHSSLYEIEPFSKHDDGMYGLVKLTVVPNEELRSILLSFASGIEVVEPESLRKNMREMIKRVLNHYKEE